jgi:CheY-like chemotaxis protein
MVNQAKIRILGVDDHPLVHDGISFALQFQRDMELVGSASNGQEAIDQFRRLLPDVTLMDLQMPGTGGLEALEAIRYEFPKARIVVLTTYSVFSIGRHDRASFEKQPNRCDEVTRVAPPSVAGRINCPGQCGTGIFDGLELKCGTESQDVRRHLRIAVESRPMQRSGAHFARSVDSPARLQHQPDRPGVVALSRVGKLFRHIVRKSGDNVWFMRESTAKRIDVAQFAGECYLQVLGSLLKQELKHVLMTKLACRCVCGAIAPNCQM